MIIAIYNLLFFDFKIHIPLILMRKCLQYVAAIVFATLTMMTVTAHAQQTQTADLGGWYVGQFIYKPNNKMFLWFETQTRSQKLTDLFYYHEFKGGIAAIFAKKHSFLIGTGDYKTYSYDGNFKTPMQAKEFRLWEQITLNHNIDRVKIEQRYRIEQRWVNGDFRSRFRYRVNPIIPLNKPSIQNNTLYLSLFEEVFFGNHAPYFERNRFFAGAGFQFNKWFAAQTGWIRQFDYNKTNDGSGKNFLQTTLMFTLDKSGPKEAHPSPMD